MDKGVILNLQRMSTEDGPGIRTTVFFKGCTLACKWCHNPESIIFRNEHEWFDSKCIRCKSCIATCPNDAITFVDDTSRIDYELCETCMNCTQACPTNALEAKGKDWTVDELYSELIKDRVYFGKEGGITLSGGEVLAQADFAYKVLSKLRANNIHTAVDTCGQVNFENIEKVFDVTSLFLYDLKIYDSNLHKRYTGLGSELILKNFGRLAEKIRQKDGTKLWVRTPLIPGITDTEDNIVSIAQVIDDYSDVIERWELLAFNNLCESKYERLNKQWNFKKADKQSAEKLKDINEILLRYKQLNGKAFVTGMGNNL